MLRRCCLLLRLTIKSTCRELWLAARRTVLFSISNLHTNTYSHSYTAQSHRSTLFSGFYKFKRNDRVHSTRKLKERRQKKRESTHPVGSRSFLQFRSCALTLPHTHTHTKTKSVIFFDENYWLEICRVRDLHAHCERRSRLVLSLLLVYYMLCNSGY